MLLEAKVLIESARSASVEYRKLLLFYNKNRYFIFFANTTAELPKNSTKKYYVNILRKVGILKRPSYRKLNYCTKPELQAIIERQNIQQLSMI